MSQNTITKIEEFENLSFDVNGHAQGFDGWLIDTEGGEQVLVGISNWQSCCEDWGYFNSDDDPSKYVGADLLSIERVTGNHHMVREYGVEGGDDSTIFVNVYTTRGVFQLAVYNSHNGYYGHTGVVVRRTPAEPIVPAWNTEVVIEENL